MIVLLAIGALAGDVVAAATGGWDEPTANLWGGVELAVHPTKDTGFEPILRVAPAFLISDRRPGLFLELGGSLVVPEDEAVTVRALLVGRVLTTLATHRLPVQLGDPDDLAGKVHPGLVPGVMGGVELAWQLGESLFVGGGKGGVGARATDFLCPPETTDVDRCLRWRPGFIGGFYGRLHHASGFFGEVVVGPTLSFSAGYHF